MKVLIVVAVMCGLVWASAARAGDEVLFGQSMGKVFLSDSPTEYQPNKTGVALFTPFTVYLVASIDYGDIGQAWLNGSVGIQAYEVGVEFPADITVIQALMRSLSINPGDDTNLIVGLSPPITANQTPIDLVEYTLGAFSTSIDLTDMRFTLHATTPSSFSPPVPGFSESSDALGCHNADGSPIKCLRPFEKAWPMSINCQQLCIAWPWMLDPVKSTSWGTLKAGFQH